MDLNMPFETANRLLTPHPPKPVHPLIPRTLDRMRNQHGGKDPISMVVFTNHPQHYTKDDEIAGKAHLLSQISLTPTRFVQQDVLWALHEAANLYGNIPQELPTNGSM
jgi:hypothetical protein